ncbi:MAG: hypothetical protein ACI9FR_000761 [Cryomorphaceae bacterium]|jgi:hypothetical protein
MNKTTTDTNNWAASNRRNTVLLLFWTVAWVASLALAAFGPKLLWNFEPFLTVLAVLINLAVGLGMILATKRHLTGLDEMQQKIFRDASVLSLGVGLVFGNSYELLEDIKLISYQPEISHLIILMTLTFMTGMILGQRKVR